MSCASTLNIIKSTNINRTEVVLEKKVINKPWWQTYLYSTQTNLCLTIVNLHVII